VAILLNLVKVQASTEVLCVSV